MEKKNRKLSGAVGLVCFLSVLLLAGCGKQSPAATAGQKEYKIVLLGKESYVYSDAGFIQGLGMAFEEAEERGIPLTFEYVDDNGEYEKGILYGSAAADDPSVLAVFTFQDFDVIETLADIFEEKKKPLLSVQGCYDTTLDSGYDYFVSAFTSAGDMGKSVADYCKREGYTRVACSHSGTEFEEEEMRGFCRRADENGVTVADMVQGPDTMTELKNICRQWESLGVEAVYLAHLTYSDTEWILKMIEYLKEWKSDIQIFGDYSLNHAESLKHYGDVLEGVVIPAPYSVSQTESYQDFCQRYQQKYQTEASNTAAQGYDLAQIFAGMVEQGVYASQEVIRRLKAQEGSQGVSGWICFDESGRLTGIEPQYLEGRDGRFVWSEEER